MWLRVSLGRGFGTSGSSMEALRSSSLRCAWSILRQPTYLENFGNDETAAAGTQLRRLNPGSVSGLLGLHEELTVISVCWLPQAS